jgi:peptidoglycan-N-acetylglucosamine deacetylase
MSLPQILAGTGLAAAGAAALTAYATLGYTSQLFGPTLVAPPHPNQLALTFDDGPNPAATPQLLELLARHNVRATFFLIGDFVRREPALTRQIHAAGHTIGNHTMHHPFLPRLAAATIREELSACNRALEDTLGQPVALFRPPHGGRRPAVLRIARELGLQTVQWNLIVGDWMPRSADDLSRRIQQGIAANRKRARGTNLVLHDGSQHGLGANRLATVQAVAGLLDRRSPDDSFVTPPQWL